MALDKFTQITKSGIVTTINFECHHLYSTGIATFSSGNISAVDGTFTGDVSIGGTLTYQDVTNIDSVGLVTARLGLNVTAGVSTFAALIDANGGVDISGGSGLVASTAKISDLTDNRVVIGGSSGELEDSANLTFDGSNLGVGSKVTVTNANADSRNVNSLGADINAAWIRIGDKAAAKTFTNGLGIKFYDQGTAHWSTGTIGNQYYVSYTGSAGDELFPSSRVDALTFNTTGAAVFASDITAGGNLYIPDRIYHASDTNTQIRFPANDTISFETAGDERLRITSTGQVAIGTDTAETGYILSMHGDLSLGEKGGVSNTYIDQKQDGDLHLINSGRTAQGASGSPGTAGVGINRFNNISGGTSLFRDFAVYNGKNSKVLVVDGSASAVGIGTDSPEALLHVSKLNGAAEIICRSSTQPRLMLKTTGTTAECRVDFGDSGDSSRGAIGYNHSDDALKFYTSGVANERLRITSGGLLLLGSSTSDLSGNHRFISVGSRHAFQYGASAGTYLSFIMGSANGDVTIDANARSGNYPPLLFNVGGSERLRISSDGNVSIGGMAPNAFSNYKTLTIGGAGASDGAGIDLERSDGNIYGRFFGDANGVQIQSAQSGDSIRFETNGANERLRITSAGLVGINETNPSYQLDVKGDSGISLVASSNSTAGQISIMGRNSSGQSSAISRLKSYPDGSSAQSHFAIETRNSSASMIERFRITSSGEINFANVTVAQKNTSGDIVIDISNLTNNGSNYWRKVGVWIMYNGIKPDATNNYSVVYYAGVGSVSTWNWLGDEDTLTSDSFSSVSLQNAAATSFRLYCDINNQNVGNVFVMVHAWNTKPTITIN